MCNLMVQCPADSATHSEIQTTHNVNIPCSDPRIQDIVNAIEQKAKNDIGNWPGTVQAVLDKCVDLAKRQSSSDVTTNIIFDGNYATTTANAAAAQMNADPTLNTTSGVQGTLVSTVSNTNSNSGGLSGGAIAGIVIGCLVAATLVIVGVVIVLTQPKDADRV